MLIRTNESQRLNNSTLWIVWYPFFFLISHRFKGPLIMRRWQYPACVLTEHLAFSSSNMMLSNSALFFQHLLTSGPSRAGMPASSFICTSNTDHVQYQRMDPFVSVFNFPRIRQDTCVIPPGPSLALRLLMNKFEQHASRRCPSQIISRH